MTEHSINQDQPKKIININIFELLTIGRYLNNFLHLIVIEILCPHVHLKFNNFELSYSNKTCIK